MNSPDLIGPDFSFRRRLVASDLLRLDEPAVIFEHSGIDDDGAPYWVYTVAGWIDGQNVATIQGGCTVGGEVIIVNADTRSQADWLAGSGLQETIDGLRQEESKRLDALAALARLEAIGPVARLELATKAAGDKSDAFEADSAAVRPLRGDDILLTVGGQSQ